jgi:hypothetical protein
MLLREQQALNTTTNNNNSSKNYVSDRLCGLVVRVFGYRSGGPVQFPALPEKM